MLLVGWPHHPAAGLRSWNIRIGLNGLIAWGFARYGMIDIANELRKRTLDEIERYYEKYGVLFEFYDDRCEVDPPQLRRKGKCVPEDSPYHQAFHDYGWTASLYLDMTIS